MVIIICCRRLNFTAVGPNNDFSIDCIHWKCVLTDRDIVNHSRRAVVRTQRVIDPIGCLTRDECEEESGLSSEILVKPTVDEWVVTDRRHRKPVDREEHYAPGQNTEDKLDSLLNSIWPLF